MASTIPEGSARDRLLNAADHLFYAEGVHTVGIDRVIEHAGVAKASLYSSFGSKEGLVLAYLELRAKRRQRRISERIAQYEDPRARILAIFELLCEIVAEPGFRGCAFANASAEGPLEAGSHVQQACLDSRAWTRALFIDLASAAHAPNPNEFGRQLTLLYNGAVSSAAVDRDPHAAELALSTAKLLLDAQLPPPHAAPRRQPARKPKNPRRVVR